MKTLRQLASAINAEYFGQDVAVGAITQDTRELKAGDIYVALKGERTDGHLFIDEAFSKGAAAVITSKKLVANQDDRPFMWVADTTEALGQMSRVWREQFDVKIAAITGSAGKTTTRNILYAILQQQAGSTLLPMKNYNNHWGVPLTLLRLQPHDCYAVLELGANHAGEIAYTAALVQADVAVLTNAGVSHLAGFGSIDGVARAKAEIFQGLKQRQGTAILNYDDKFYDFWRQQLPGVRCISFGCDENADIYASNIEINAEGCCFTLHLLEQQRDVVLPLLGVHNIKNALAAVAAALALNIAPESIVKGLRMVKPEPGRLALLPAVAGVQLIDDTYNASVNAMLSALEVLAMFNGRRVAVLGDMAELGDAAVHYHRQVGKKARDLGIDNLYVVGEKMQYTAEQFGYGAYHFASKQELVGALNLATDHPVTVLVKGARSMRMEDVVYALQQQQEVLC